MSEEKEPIFRSEADVEAYEYDQHIFHSVCGGVSYDEEDAWNEMMREEVGEE